MAVAKAKADDQLNSPVVQPDCPAPEAFLEEAKTEPQRKLLWDHIRTIKVLRDEKKFTFRAISEWLARRGIEVDHSAVYRAYLASIPEEERNPFQDWSHVDKPDFADDNAK